MSARACLAVSLAAAMTTACATADASAQGSAAATAVPLAMAASAPEHGAAMFKAPDGSERGGAILTAAPTGVLIGVTLRGLTPGWHAIHLHQRANCTDPAFEAAGGHVNHAQARPHGLLNPRGPDPGDLPNVFAQADGTVNAQMFTTLVSLRGEGGRPALLDGDGSSLVVHANRDDYTTQPIGGAGERVACAEIKQ